MIHFHCRNSLQPLLFATALPLALLAAGAMSADAGTVTVTGANGANGAPSKPGSAGGSATATAASSDSSNSATATGGNGGAGGTGSTYYGIPVGAGGAGGAASSSATASNPNGSASATATSTGGNGGRGGLPTSCIHTCFPGRGGSGGAASAISSATGGGEYSVASSSTAHGGAGGLLGGAPGHASAGASALSSGQGPVDADASAFSLGGGASVTASAKNPSGSIVTTAAVPPGSRALYSAVAESVAVGSAPIPVAISAGQAVSNAALMLTSGTGLIGVGAMSAGYVLSTASTYQTTAVFNFTAPPTAEALDLKLTSDDLAASSAGIGFDSLDLQVLNEMTGESLASLSFTSSSAAETFFNGGQVSLGAGTGSQSIEIEYFLNYNSGTSAGLGDGFGFTYALVDPPLSATIPEPSTWAMMLVGFAGLAFAGYWARVGPAGVKNDVTNEN
jgi:hypothetical protein